MSDREKAFISVILGSLLGGATAAVTKIGLLDIPPFAFVFSRFLIASLIMLPFVNFKTIIKDSIRLVPLSIFFTANILIFIWGVRLTTATISQLLYAGVPLLTSLILYLFFKQKQGIIKNLGVLIGFIGVIIIVILPVLEGERFSGDLEGNILISLGVVLYSFFMVYSKVAQNKYTPFTITAALTFITTLIALPFFLVELLNTSSSWWLDLGLNSTISLFYVAIASTVVVYLLNQYAIKHGGSVFASMLLYLSPLFGYLVAAVLLGEGITRGLIFGAILILSGVYLVTKK